MCNGFISTAYFLSKWTALTIPLLFLIIFLSSHLPVERGLEVRSRASLVLRLLTPTGGTPHDTVMLNGSWAYECSTRVTRMCDLSDTIWQKLLVLLFSPITGNTRTKGAYAVEPNVIGFNFSASCKRKQNTEARNNLTGIKFAGRKWLLSKGTI